MCSGPWFNIKMPSYRYRKSNYGDKTILRPSYLHNGISYSGKTTSLYWIRPLFNIDSHRIYRQHFNPSASLLPRGLPMAYHNPCRLDTYLHPGLSVASLSPCDDSLVKHPLGFSVKWTIDTKTKTMMPISIHWASNVTMFEKLNYYVAKLCFLKNSSEIITILLETNQPTSFRAIHVCCIFLGFQQSNAE